MRSPSRHQEHNRQRNPPKSIGASVDFRRRASSLKLARQRPMPVRAARSKSPQLRLLANPAPFHETLPRNGERRTERRLHNHQGRYWCPIRFWQPNKRATDHEATAATAVRTECTRTGRSFTRNLHAPFHAPPPPQLSKLSSRAKNTTCFPSTRTARCSASTQSIRRTNVQIANHGENKRVVEPDMVCDDALYHGKDCTAHDGHGQYAGSASRQRTQFCHSRLKMVGT